MYLKKAHFFQYGEISTASETYCLPSRVFVQTLLALRVQALCPGKVPFYLEPCPFLAWAESSGV